MNGGEVHPKWPDWWKASDGLWYPPEAHPSRAVQAPVAQQVPQRQGSDFRRAMNVGFGIGCGLIALVLVLLVALAVLVALAG